MDLKLTEIARLTGKHFNTVRYMLQGAGIGFKDMGQGRPKLYDSVEALCVVLRPEIESTMMPEAVDLDYNAERARLAKEQADEKELKNQQLRGELIDTDTVDQEWARIIVSAKTQFLALPDRLTQMLEVVSDKEDRRQMIDREIKTILTVLANEAN